MTPPADGENVKIGASAAAAAMQTAPTEELQVSAQSKKASAAPGTPEMAPAETGGEEEDEMVDALEDLILEAYNNMQIDGEYIFLPDEVAEKLHQVAEQMTLQQSEKEQQTENITRTGEDSGSEDATASKAEVEEVKVPQQEVPTDRPEPEQENEQKQEKAQVKESQKVGEQDERDNTSEEDETRLRKVQVLQAEAAELREEQHKQRIPRVMSMENIFMELPSVPEIDESASSGPSSPSPPLSRSHSGANTPKARTQIPAQGHGCFPLPPLISLTSTPSSVAASPDHIGKSPLSRTPDQSGGSSHKSKVLTYETRREAALKLKEDKKKRAFLVRETARKQREDSKRQLEEAHQREMEEKRERVRRIREERLHRRSEKSTGAQGTKKNG